MVLKIKGHREDIVLEPRKSTETVFD